MWKANPLWHRIQIFILMLVVMGLAACNLTRNLPKPAVKIELQSLTVVATETLPPYTPLPSLTPSRTLKPPPTLRIPTATIQSTSTPLATPSPTLDLSVNIPGLRGAETATPTTTPGCVPNKDWKLTYTVKQNDALVRIADLYDTTAKELALGNCLRDMNIIIVGQVLHVPGTSQPVVPEVQCGPFEVLTPVDGTFSVSGGGTVTFVWHGPRAPRNMIRVIKPDGSKFEAVVDLRQNEVVDLDRNLPSAGTYTWYVIPLDKNFVQACPQGGPWTFTKPQAPPPI